jgi:hypothetical protein
MIRDVLVRYNNEVLPGKLSQRPGARRLPRQVDANESAKGFALVDRIFDAFVRQTEALMGHIQRSICAMVIGEEPAPWTIG